MRTWRKSVSAFIDDVYTKGCKASGKGVFRIERLAKTEAGCDSPYDGDERIIYSDFAYWIQAEQFVEESESEGRDGYEEQ